MKSASTGTPARSRSRPGSVERRDAGFSLLEALVALALVSAFAAVLGPHLFQARRIAAQADDRLAAQVLLRTLLDAPFDRSNLANVSRTGESGALRWRLVTEPMPFGVGVPGNGPSWAMVRVAASVSWGPGHVVAAETVRLAKAE
jgi:prepilin-type N-terminal cleavage/methylation domain-containing protein